ncbi:unnamed protein product [Hermetia illucens]|uniref:Homeobox domain-containing protein n=2 Tax=Hermetia illucens TaxID=343691 RepID=A0A7R8V0J2_HERIL|nr:unnamed protein product [Hermetia illucens]
MMPMAPGSAITIPPPSSTKPKIGFSIDSIVGGATLQSHVLDSSLSPRSESSERPSSPLSDCSYPLELRHSNDLNRNFRFQNDRFQHDSFHRNFDLKLRENLSNLGEEAQRNSSPPPPHHSRLSPATDPDGRSHPRSPSPHPSQQSSKGPILVPGIPAGLIRPFPVQPQNIAEVKTVPPYLNPSDIGNTPNPHFLAAHFQMAAALAHGQSGQGFPPNAGLQAVAHHQQFPGGPNMIRDSYPLYPWLLSRHGRIFPHRFPGNFLLQPFRKPKRVRTAFSPSQLLKLEHAFESNHYVVGAERKTLAQVLSLTETQVKVWFQNRRTKHKRMQQEENSKGGNSNNSTDGNNMGENNASSPTSYVDENEDELIDMDDCSSDQEESDLVP